MSYSESCEAFELIDGHILKARCQNVDGEWCDSEIDLAPYIGNDNGEFVWGGENYHESAHSFNLEEGYRLTADLANVDGEYSRAAIDLNEHIGNDNGQLVYCE